ncbi:MAG: L-serine ammonia-lyase [Rhodoglobus sp.]
MPLSSFDLFTVGIGPSSSHTVGPMRAAASFAADLVEHGMLDQVSSLTVRLYGSLAATGAGHGTMKAVLIGLEGYLPDQVLPAQMELLLERISLTGMLQLAGSREVAFSEAAIALHPLTVLAGHPNGMRFAAHDAGGAVVLEATYFSIGGGFIYREGESRDGSSATGAAIADPLPFRTAAQLLAHCRAEGLNFSGVMLRNELARRTAAEVTAGLLHIRDVMDECKNNSLERSGNLPGTLNVRRRAPDWHRRLRSEDPHRDPAFWQEWVNLVALAVNEENASGGRVVTAPTNGAAGIIPAVLFYATHYAPGMNDADQAAKDDVTVRFLLASAAVGVLYKRLASISGAEVGCQGEVGSASSMAAAGLAEILGGTPEQVENAAEIAMEHNLGLTCDPIGGLVQIPCIERNAIAAAKAINAAKMAMWGDGTHRVSLDEVIITMAETGKDMSSRYKETSMGGLAVNVVEC